MIEIKNNTRQYIFMNECVKFIKEFQGYIVEVIVLFGTIITFTFFKYIKMKKENNLLKKRIEKLEAKSDPRTKCKNCGNFMKVKQKDFDLAIFLTSKEKDKKLYTYTCQCGFSFDSQLNFP
jgi:hypothetical protein